MDKKPEASIGEFALEQLLLVGAIWSLYRGIHILALSLGGLLLLWPTVRDRHRLRKAYSQEDLDREPQLKHLVKRNMVIIGSKFWLGVALLFGATYLAFEGSTGFLTALLPYLVGAALAGLGIVVFLAANWSTYGWSRNTLRGNRIVLKACGVLLVLSGGVLVVAYAWK